MGRMLMLLTDAERRNLKRILLCYVAHLATRKTSNRILSFGDPLQGHIIEDGKDVTLQIAEEEKAARELLRKLP